MAGREAIGRVTRWVFYAWMFVLPYEAIVPTWLPEFLQGNLSLARIAGVLLTLCFLADIRLWPWRLPPVWWLFAAFFGIFMFSMLRYDLTNFMVVFQQFQLIMLFFISYNLFLIKDVPRGALLAFAVSCGTAAVMTYLGLNEDVYSSIYQERMMGLGRNPNLYAKMLGIGALAAIGLGHVRREKITKYLPLVWLLALAMIIDVARSGSRGQTLALAVGLAMFTFRQGTIWVMLRNIVLMAAIAIAAAYIFLHTDVLRERWRESWETGVTAGRDKIFRESFEMIKEKPLIGWGPAAKTTLADRLYYRAGPERATHNTVLAMLTQTGLIGSIPYFCGLAVVFWLAWLARKGEENVLPLAIFLALWIGDMVTGGLPAKLHWTFFAYMLAAGATTLTAGASSKSK